MKKKIGQVGFFKACEALRNHREEIENTCKTKDQVREFLGAKIGEPAPESTLASICEATEIRFSFSKPVSDVAAKNWAVIINSLITLFEEFGIPVPNDLQELFKRALGRLYRAPVKPIPVASLPRASEIPVVAGPPSGKLVNGPVKYR